VYWRTIKYYKLKQNCFITGISAAGLPQPNVHGDCVISERLIRKREEAGLKQAELARRIGVGRDSYNRYERSGTQPSLEVLARIATELNTTTDYLLGNSTDSGPRDQKAAGFAERFLQLRMERRMTQEEFAAGFSGKYHRECTQDVVSRYENGRKIPEITTLLDIADYFGVSEAYLRGDSDIREAGPLEAERRYRAKKLSEFAYDDWQICKIIEEGNLDRLYEEALSALKEVENNSGLSVKESYALSAENQPGLEKTAAAVIQLDETEVSMITDFREMDADSKKDLLRIAKILAENSRLKKMLRK